MLERINWKIGKYIVSQASFSLVGMSGDAKDSLMNEITTNTKIISGATGVPPHFLGMPDILSNRATAQEMGDLMIAATDKERKIWTGAYNELIRKALLMANKYFNKGFNPEIVKASLPYMSESKLRELIDVWLPLHQSSIIDDETILNKIPGVDIERILDNKRKESVKLIQELQAKVRADEEIRDEEEEFAKAGGRI
jgi:hypothetical protein